MISTRGIRRHGRSASQHVLWISTSLETRGGIATFVRNMRDTALWSEWNVRHIATHRNGSVAVRIRAFTVGISVFLNEVIFHRPSLIHIHTSSDGSFFRKGILTWLAIAFKIPIVLHVHGSEFHRFYDESPVLLRRLIRTTIEHSDAVVALGIVWAKRLQEIAPRASITVIPNGTRPHIAVDHTASRTVRVAFIGKICARKGTFLLLEAWQTVVRDPTIATSLTIAGDGDFEKAQASIRALGIEATVDLRGWLSPGEVDQLLSETHVLVLPSFNEGQPMAILEAMARGIAVIASTAGGIPEMVGTAGILVEPGDVNGLGEALSLMLTDPDKRCRLGAEARQRIENEFNLTVVARQFDVLYRTLVA